MLEQSETVRLVVVVDKDAGSSDKMVRDQKLAAALIVPQGFGMQSNPPTLVALAEMPAGKIASSAVQSAVKRVLGAAEIAHISSNALAPARTASKGSLAAAGGEDAFTMANVAWQQPVLGVTSGRTTC